MSKSRQNRKKAAINSPAKKPILAQKEDVANDAVTTSESVEDSAKMAPLPDEIEAEARQRLADESEKETIAGSSDVDEKNDNDGIASLITEDAKFIPNKYWFGNVHIKGIGVVNGQVREDHLKEFKRLHAAGQAASGLKEQDQIPLNIDYWVRPIDELARKRRNDRKVKE